MGKEHEQLEERIKQHERSSTCWCKPLPYIFSNLYWHNDKTLYDDGDMYLLYHPESAIRKRQRIWGGYKFIRMLRRTGGQLNGNR